MALLEHGTDPGKGQNASILVLPSEIVVEVFRYTQLKMHKEDGLELYMKGPRRDTWSWIAVTHICKRWRDIGVGTQNLWNFIEPARCICVHHTALYLARSGTLPLTVYYNARKGSEDLAYQCFCLVIAHLHRIRDLKIWCLHGCAEELRIMLFESPAPVMQSLAFETMTMEEFDPRSLFAGQAPNLEKLSWEAYSPSNTWPEAPLIRNLKYLRTAACSLSVNDVLSVFSQNANLECVYILTMRNSVEQPSSLLPFQLPIVLPLLKFVCLSDGRYNQVSGILENTIFPELTSWIISCSEYPIRPSMEANKKGIMPHHTNDIEDCTFLELTVCSTHAKINADDGDSDGINVYDDSGGSHRSLTYKWANGLDPTDERVPINQCFSFICSVIDGGFWCAAKELVVEIELEDNRYMPEYENLEASTWTMVLRMLPKLQRLTVRCGLRSMYDEPLYYDKNDHHGILEALATRHKDNEGTPILICPELSELRIDGMNLKRASNLRVLKHALRFRTSHGKQIDRLYLCGPHGKTDKIIDSLQEGGLTKKTEAFYCSESDPDSA